MKAIALLMALFAVASAAEQGGKDAFERANAKYLALLETAKTDPSYENKWLACQGWYQWYLAAEAEEDRTGDRNLHARHSKLSDEHWTACRVVTSSDGQLVAIPRG